MTGYDFFTNEVGKRCAVNLATGEITDAIPIEVPIGSIVYTPEAQDAYRKRKDYEIELAMQMECNSPLGNFYWTIASATFKDLSPATATRLIFLVTFARYDKALRTTKRSQPIKRAQLSELLGLSEKTADRFWNEVSDTYLIEKDEAIYLSENKIFHKGKLSAHIGEAYFKTYIEWVQRLYYACPKNNHKQLGYIFQMLPYINREYNILCINPSEKDIGKIEALTIEDFCGIIGYDISNVGRLFKVYKEVRFEVNGRYERFVAVVYDGTERNKGKIVINPRIMYRGSDYRKVESYTLFYKD